VSSLNQKLENAVLHAIRARANDPDSTDTSELYSGDGSLIVNESGLAIILTSGTTLNVPIYTGYSEDERKAPCITVTSLDCTADEDSPWWFVPVTVEVRMGADSDSFTPDKWAAMESLSRGVADVMGEPTFHNILSEQSQHFTADGVKQDEDRRSRTVEGRTHVASYSRTYFCIESDIE